MPATYDAIATTTLNSTQSSVTFSSISQSYTDLLLVGNTGMNTTTGFAFCCRLNGSTASEYVSTYMSGAPSGSFPGGYAAQNLMVLGAPAKQAISGNIFVHFLQYKNTNVTKSVIARTQAGSESVWLSVGVWTQYTAINQIQLFPETASWLSGSTFTLYGITQA